MNFRKPKLDEQIAAWLSTRVGISPNTLRNYEGTVRSWRDSGLSPVDYIASLLERGNKHSTVKVRRSILNAFLDWQVARGYSSENVLRQSAQIRADKPVVEALTLAEVAALLEGCEQLGKGVHRDSNAELGLWPQEAYRKRLAAMVALQVSTGLRLQELLDLTWGDLDLNARTGQVWGKGRKQRPFRFGVPAKRALMRWMAEVRVPAKTFLVFHTPTGKAVDPSTYRKQLKEAAWWAGIGHVHPHMLRHTFATNAAAAGAPLHDLAQMLGHESVATTQVYVSERDRDRAWRDLDSREAATNEA